jgi:tRNA U34 5-carboxymethylaminomethyl modifying enzyme MnmG/GidA
MNLKKMVLQRNECFWLQKKSILESKDTALITQGDKMFVFSRPQIDLEDIMKFDKVAAYVQKNDLDQEILEQAEIQVKYSGYIEKKETMRINCFD